MGLLDMLVYEKGVDGTKQQLGLKHVNDKEFLFCTCSFSTYISFLGRRCEDSHRRHALSSKRAFYDFAFTPISPVNFPTPQFQNFLSVAPFQTQRSPSVEHSIINVVNADLIDHGALKTPRVPER